LAFVVIVRGWSVALMRTIFVLADIVPWLPFDIRLYFRLHSWRIMWNFVIFTKYWSLFLLQFFTPMVGNQYLGILL
jgi:hypothetical protein